MSKAKPDAGDLGTRIRFLCTSHETQVPIVTMHEQYLGHDFPFADAARRFKAGPESSDSAVSPAYRGAVKLGVREVGQR